MIKNTANVYHYLCVGMSDTDFKKVLPMNKAKWKSPVCKISKKPYKIILLALNCQTTLKNNIGISIPIRSTSVNLKNLLNPRPYRPIFFYKLCLIIHAHTHIIIRVTININYAASLDGPPS